MPRSTASRRELGSAAPEMAEELSIAAVELGLLPERRQALENLQRRVDLPQLRAMVGTLQQTEKYGTPLAQALRVLASELRDQRLLKAEDKAARLPAILTVPMIIFILPCLFVVMLGPAILRMIDGLGKYPMRARRDDRAVRAPASPRVIPARPGRGG